MAEKKKRRSLPKLAMALVFALVVIYTAYHLSRLFGEEILTIASGVATESEGVSASGYIFRDEKVMTSANSGAVDYLTKNGQKVSVGQTLANVYSSGGDENVKSTITLLDESIALLEQSTKASIGNDDIAQLRERANDIYCNITGLLSSQSTEGLELQAEKLLIILNQMSVLIDEKATVTDTLNMLKAAKSDIFEDAGGHVAEVTMQSGYFYNSVDGYEDAFTMSAADSLTAESFYSLKGAVDSGFGSASDNAYGKLGTDSRWAFALSLDEKYSERFSIDTEYNLRFKENNDTVLPMTLGKMISDGERNGIILVFYCNRLPDNFSLSRCQNVEIEIASVSGIYIPDSALVRVDGIKGVYVLRGSVVKFRVVEIIYRGSDYYLVSAEGEGVGEYAYLDVNEMVVTSGSNLFDGRILE